MPQQDPGKGLGIASMVLGIVSLVIPFAGLATAIVGLILGVLAKKKSAEVGMQSGMATAGIVCSIIGLAGAAIILITCLSCGACTVCASNPYYW